MKEVKLGVGRSPGGLNGATAALRGCGAAQILPGVWRLRGSESESASDSASAPPVPVPVPESVPEPEPVPPPCVRVLPSSSSALVLRVDDTAHCADALSELGLNTEPIGITSAPGSRGQLCVHVPELGGVELRLCDSPEVTPFFHEGQHAVVGADPRFIEEIQPEQSGAGPRAGPGSGSVVQNCWAEARAMLRRPAMMWAEDDKRELLRPAPPSLRE